MSKIPACLCPHMRYLRGFSEVANDTEWQMLVTATGVWFMSVFLVYGKDPVNGNHYFLLLSHLYPLARDS